VASRRGEEHRSIRRGNTDSRAKSAGPGAGERVRRDDERTCTDVLYALGRQAGQRAECRQDLCQEQRRAGWACLHSDVASLCTGRNLRVRELLLVRQVVSVIEFMNSRASLVCNIYSVADLLSSGAAVRLRSNGNLPSPCDDCGVPNKG